MTNSSTNGPEGDASAIRERLAELVEAVQPGLMKRLDTEPAAFLPLISLMQAVGSEAQAALTASVDAARASGLSWDRIGAQLGISRQAAQQRFGHAPKVNADGVWRMSPVTALDEMERLEAAGRQGWRSIGFGTLFHDLVHTDEQWEYRRVGVFSQARRELEAGGWSRVGTMWFPWAYFARPTGKPAEPEFLIH